MAITSPGQHAATDDAGLRPAGPERGVGAALLAGGLVGAVVSLVLLLDELALLADPGYVPSCSIDPVLSCGTIMRTEQAAVLGFPNPVLGLLTYPVVAALGALVLGGVALPRRAWWGPQAGTTAGMLFVHWLIAQSLGVIGALCPVVHGRVGGDDRDVLVRHRHERAGRRHRGWFTRSTVHPASTSAFRRRRGRPPGRAAPAP